MLSEITPTKIKAIDKILIRLTFSLKIIIDTSVVKISPKPNPTSVIFSGKCCRVLLKNKTNEINVAIVG